LIFSLGCVNDKKPFVKKGRPMKNSLKGALLSGLLFPGAGQLKLKRYGRGISLILVATISLAVFLIKAMQKAFTILDQLQSDGGFIDMNAISKAAAQASTASDDLAMNVCFFLIITCWIVGIVDAYLTGGKMDKELNERKDT